MYFALHLSDSSTHLVANLVPHLRSKFSADTAPLQTDGNNVLCAPDGFSKCAEGLYKGLQPSHTCVPEQDVRIFPVQLVVLCVPPVTKMDGPDSIRQQIIDWSVRWSLFVHTLFSCPVFVNLNPSKCFMLFFRSR